MAFRPPCSEVHSPAPLAVLPLGFVPREDPRQARERGVHEQIIPEIAVGHHIHVPVRLQHLLRVYGLLRVDKILNNFMRI